MLKTRVIFGAIFILAVIGLLMLDNWLAQTRDIAWAPMFYLIVGLLILAGVHELCTLMRCHGWQVHEPLAALASLALLLPLDIIGSPLNVVTPLVMAVLVFETVRVWRGGAVGLATGNIAGTLLAFLYIGVLMNYVVALRFIDLGGVRGFYALAVFLAVAKLSDMGAYFTGRAVGRHKMCPTLSPNKTLEGLAGAFVFGVGAALGLGMPLLGLPWWQLAVFGVVVTAFAVVGDLAESLIKRATEAKDSGTTFPAFGGVLDIIDSILLSAPAAYYLLLAFGAQAG
jgi:phosphatidate cytidylyltransferase